MLASMRLIPSIPDEAFRVFGRAVDEGPGAATLELL
jgi:hypothetical protein